MPFLSEDEIIAAPKLEWSLHKITAATTAGVFYSTWDNSGTPGAGSAPAAGSGTPGAGGTAHDNTAGAVFFDDNDPDEKYLTGWSIEASQAGNAYLYERLVTISGITTHTSTGLRDVNSVALPRYTDGVGLEVWAEVTTATNTTAPIVNLRYTSESGGAGSGRQGGNVTFPAVATAVRSMIRFPLQSGDRGVQSVQSVDIVTASASTGVINVCLVKRLAAIQLTASTTNFIDFVHRFPSLPRIYDGASIFVVWLPTGPTPANINGTIHLAVKES